MKKIIGPVVAVAAALSLAVCDAAETLIELAKENNNG